jgi:hypothetical protein
MKDVLGHVTKLTDSGIEISTQEVFEGVLLATTVRLVSVGLVID